jgi:hypothetical protein
MKPAKLRQLVEVDAKLLTTVVGGHYPVTPRPKLVAKCFGARKEVNMDPHAPVRRYILKEGGDYQAVAGKNPHAIAEDQVPANVLAAFRAASCPLKTS